MKKIIIIYIMLISTILNAKELHILIKEEIKTTDTSKEKPLETKEISNKKICLGDNYFYIITNENKILYDFKNKKIYCINLKPNTYSEISLYSIIGFNSSEIINRIYLYETLTKSGIEKEKNPYKNLFDFEILFSIEHPKIPKPAIVEKKIKDQSIYSINNEIYTKCLFDSGKKLNNYKNIFKKYLIYNCFLHPVIREKILSRNLFIKELYYKKTDTFIITEVNSYIEKIEETDNEPNEIPGSYKKTHESNQEILKIIESIETKKPKRFTKDEYINFINNSINNKNYLEAFLVLIEYMLENGEILNDEAQRIKPYVNTDTNLSLYLNGSILYKENKIEEAIKSYNSISRKNLERDYNIDIQLAVMYMSLNQSDEAIKYYLKALRKNPYITSVYKDMGYIYYNSYDMVLAWEVWDTAKNISPNHSILNGIFELEKNLEKNFPEYF